jgi:hypothetical protein
LASAREDKIELVGTPPCPAGTCQANPRAGVRRSTLSARKEMPCVRFWDESGHPNLTRQWQLMTRLRHQLRGYCVSQHRRRPAERLRMCQARPAALRAIA